MLDCQEDNCIYLGTNRGRGRKCVSSFDSGHASRAASMLIFTTFEVHMHVQKRNFQILNFKFNNWNRGATHNKHSTDEGHSPETSGHLLRFWHFHHQHSKRLLTVFTCLVLTLFSLSCLCRALTIDCIWLVRRFTGLKHKNKSTCIL